MPDRLHTPSKQPSGQSGNKLFEEKDIYVPAPNSQANNNLSPISAISAFTEGTSFWQQASWNQEKKAKVRFAANDANNASFDTLQTIDMLNFKFIRSCESAGDLKRILRILQQTRNDSPLLLQEAKDRLEILQQRQTTRSSAHPTTIQESEKEEESPSKEYFSAYAANISRITNGNTTLESIDPSKSASLSLTLSPQSVLQGVNFVDTPTEYETTPSFPPSISNTSANTNNSRGKETRLSPIEETSGCKRSAVMKEGELSREVQQLSKQALALDATRTCEQSSFMEKMRDLEKAKHEAELLVESLKGKVHQADAQTRDLEHAVVVLTTKHQKTHQELENERQALRKRDEEAKALEQRLQAKISSLLKELKKSEESSRLVKGAEKSLRLKREQELSEQQKKNKELNEMLQEAYKNLESVKQRQSKFRLEMFRVMGMSVNEWRNIPHRDLLAEITHRIKVMREENRTAQSMSEDKHKIAEERNRLDARLAETLQEKGTLEAENMKLSEKIQELAQEVASSRAYIDKLLKTSNDVEQSEWESREEKYKTVIKNLRQQIRKQASAVSIDLYKNAVDDGKKKKTDLMNAEKKIASLVSKVNQLQKEHNSRTSAPMSSPEGKDAVRRVATSPTEYLSKGVHSKSLGKPIRPALNFTTETPRNNEVLQSDKEPARLENLPEDSSSSLVASTPARKLDLSIQNTECKPKNKISPASQQRHAIGLQNATTKPVENQRKPGWSVPKYKASPASQQRHAPALQNATTKPVENQRKPDWSVPKYKASPASQTRHAPARQKVTIKATEDRHLKTNNSLIGFNVFVPTDCIEESQRVAERMEDESVLAWVDNYSRTHQMASNNAQKKSSKKALQTIQKRTKLEQKNGNALKSPLLIRRDRRLRREAKTNQNGKSRQIGSTVNDKEAGSSTAISKVVVESENVDPGKLENQTNFLSPKSPKAPSTTPMRKALRVGGRKALADKLKKMRSPAPEKN